ncbi:MAG: class IV adenylate cyclase [Candidatus Thorarchaeota archaeon]
MAIEVEIKVEIENLPGLEKSILDKGGELVKCESQEDLYLDHPKYSFADTDEALRIRKILAKPPSNEETIQSAQYELTYKGAKIDSRSKTRDELSVEVDSGETMLAILKAVGFRDVATVRKERTYFRMDGVSITIDSVEGLGWFLEIEQVVQDDEQVESTRDELFKLLDTLLSGEYESIRESYLELLLSQ